MADFIEQDWNGYKIKLWPSDPFRKQIAMQRLEAAVLYFNTTNIRFDMRISRINDKKVAEDTITYEWWLCKHNKPIKDPQDGTFFFINPTGCGTFQFSTAKKRIYKNTDMIPIKYGNFVGNRKLVAIDIGRIGELDHYTVVMKFNTTSGAPSPPFEMAGFTVFDRDIFTRYYILSALAIVTVTIISIILKACGISS